MSFFSVDITLTVSVYIYIPIFDVPHVPKTLFGNFVSYNDDEDDDDGNGYIHGIVLLCNPYVIILP